ncbi:hypothetical protein BDZ45DRAFT_489443 [Acephala macrosclerotiorum]|nr:hypothetical protein BDZ45DRAFT_489443 [Acephala macrosclerotiorum]
MYGHSSLETTIDKMDQQNLWQTSEEDEEARPIEPRDYVVSGVDGRIIAMTHESQRTEPIQEEPELIEQQATESTFSIEPERDASPNATVPSHIPSLPVIDQAPALSWTAQLDTGIAARIASSQPITPSSHSLTRRPQLGAGNPQPRQTPEATSPRRQPPSPPDRPCAICVSLGKEGLSYTYNVNGCAPCDHCAGKGYSPDKCQAKDSDTWDGDGNFDENGDWYEHSEEDEGEGV